MSSPSVVRRKLPLHDPPRPGIRRALGVIVLHLLTMNIYDQERDLRNHIYFILAKIRKERPNVTGQTLAQYSQTLRKLHAVQDEITSLEEA